MKLRVALSILFLSASIHSVFADHLTFRADVWCPYNCEPTAKKPGFLVEIAKLALAEQGHSLEYDTLNWARALAETEEGKYTGVFGAAKSDAPNFIFPDVAIGNSVNCFYTKTDSTWNYSGLLSLEGLVVGVIKDYTYQDEIDQYILRHLKNPKRIDVVSGDNPLELNLKKLQMGRIGAFIEDRFVLQNYHFLRNLELKVKESGCVKESDIYIAFSPKHEQAKAYAQIITNKVKEMRANGTFKTLLASYGVEDWLPH